MSKTDNANKIEQQERKIRELETTLHKIQTSQGLVLSNADKKRFGIFGKKRSKKPLDKKEERYNEFLEEECGHGCSLCSSCQNKLRKMIM